MKKQATSDTSVKIFSAFGGAGIDSLDAKVNNFIEQDDIQVISITPQMCSIGDGQSEIYQNMTITIWYRHL